MDLWRVFESVVVERQVCLMLCVARLVGEGRNDANVAGSNCGCEQGPESGFGLPGSNDRHGPLITLPYSTRRTGFGWQGYSSPYDGI